MTCWASTTSGRRYLMSSRVAGLKFCSMCLPGGAPARPRADSRLTGADNAPSERWNRDNFPSAADRLVYGPPPADAITTLVSVAPGEKREVSTARGYAGGL